MKKLLALILFAVLIVCAVTPCTGATQQNDNVVPQDSTLSVIGWFCERDTVVYWIKESAWKLNNGDTIKTAGVSTQVMITVTDSTATGYKMNYTFLDVRGDSLAESELGNLQNKIVTLLGKKIIGTTISFETNECGKIEKINNLGKIKKQAKALFKEAVKEMEKAHWAKGLKNLGIDLTEYTKGIDTDLLVEGYIEELKMLFMCHGGVYDLGETTETEEATETQYANESYCSVTIDDDKCYSILFDVVSTIPQSDIKAMLSGVVDNLNASKVKDNFNAHFDTDVNEDCNFESYFKIAFFPNGWPYEVVKQETTMIGENSKVKQKYIYLDTYSFYNY